MSNTPLVIIQDIVLKDGNSDFSNIIRIIEKFPKMTISIIVLSLVNAYFNEVDSEKQPNLNFTYLIQ